MVLVSKNKIFGKKKAFTLGDMMMALIVVGIIAAMTIPILANKSDDKEIISSFTKFNDNLEEAIKKWKLDLLCKEDSFNCLSQQNLSADNCANFEQIGKYLNIGEKLGIGENPNTISWLPEKDFEYNGDEQTGTYGGVSKLSSNTCRYVLLYGTTFSVKINPAGFDIQVDANGIKLPNRMGKDIFTITIGEVSGKDIYYYPALSQAETNTVGLCSLPESNCKPDNYDPTISNGASITPYIILNKKLPDFKELSEKIPGFKR